MTPSNPSNNNPFIYRILDSLGIPHQVVPVNHTHDKLIGQSISLIIGGTEVEIELSDLPNLIRALADPDATPITNSTKLVTSGGVAAALAGKADTSAMTTALAGKQDTLTFDSAPTANSTNPVTSGGVKTALDGKANSSHSHTVSQITDFNSAVATKVDAGVADAIRGVAIKDVEVDANTTYDLDDHMADMKGRQALILLTNADPQEDSIYKYIISGTGIDISFDDSNRKLENGVTYLISIIYMENEKTYNNGWYFVSVLSTFS